MNVKVVLLMLTTGVVRSYFNSHGLTRYAKRPDRRHQLSSTDGATPVAFALHHRHIVSTDGPRSSLVAATSPILGDAAHSDTVGSRHQNLVIFRAPSRHTYGFVRRSNYDLPLVELRTLLCSIASIHDENDINFIPAGLSLQRSDKAGGEREPRPTSKQQSKKKKAKNPQVQLLYWIESSGKQDITAMHISKAASRAILTHATFSINESISCQEDEWKIALINSNVSVHLCSNILDQMDIIDMTNPNMSREERSKIIGIISCLIQERSDDIQLRLEAYLDGNRKAHPVIIHCTTPTHSSKTECLHHVYFGYWTSIGPAGTEGAPSQTLRRTHRGILKTFALKNRKIGISENTSTAMEPEIGFLMANLALAGVNKSISRVLDPCCGSGGLLLYCAALGAESLIGVDSYPNVWTGSELEFQKHVCMDDKKLTLPTPTFFNGDVLNPLATEALCGPNSFDAIVCDPPYNVGAPVMMDGKDKRPTNYHFRDTNNSMCESNQDFPDLVPHILQIARQVLVDGGRIVFFLAVRGEELHMPIETLLLSKGCSQWEVGEGEGEKNEKSMSLHLLRNSTILQQFSPTFARWLVTMQKRAQ